MKAVFRPAGSGYLAEVTLDRSKRGEGLKRQGSECELRALWIAGTLGTLEDQSVRGGEGGIRTHGGHKGHNGFRDRPIQPLWHLSSRAGIPGEPAGDIITTNGAEFGAPGAQPLQALVLGSEVKSERTRGDHPQLGSDCAD